MAALEYSRECLGHISPVALQAGGKRKRLALGYPSRPLQRRSIASLIEEIERRERNVLRVLPKGCHHLAARFFNAARLRGPDAELARRFEASRANDLLGGLGARTENAGHGAAVRGEDRAVGEANVDFLVWESAREEVLDVL